MTTRGAQGEHREQPHYNLIAAQSLPRVAALSDGIFAVAMTLLVLGLAVPAVSEVRGEGQLGIALWNLLPSLVTYLMSFLTLGIFWAGQQTQLNHLERSDRNLTWIYLGFLLTVSLMPFSTGLLAHFIGYRLALLVYWLNIFVLGALLYASLAYAQRAGLVMDVQSRGTLLMPRDQLVKALRRRIVVAQALYAIAAVLAIVNTYVSIALIVAVQLNYAIAPPIPILRRL